MKSAPTTRGAPPIKGLLLFTLIISLFPACSDALPLESHCGGGIDCKCIGAAHYDTHAYRICPWGVECYGVRYRRSSVPNSGHVTSDSSHVTYSSTERREGYGVSTRERRASDSLYIGETWSSTARD